MMGFGFLFIGMFFLGFILLLAWVIGEVFKQGRNPLRDARHHRENSISAREILDRRYAIGEISPEEYERIKKDLS